MTARELFKNIPHKGKIIKLSKGGYRDANFGYRIVDTGKEYQVTVLSDIHPKEYTVPYGPETNATTLETAILYNEWRARVMHNKQLGAQS
jgi:hypothetical protein